MAKSLPTLKQALGHGPHSGLPTVRQALGHDGGKLPSLKDALKNTAVAAPPVKHKGGGLLGAVGKYSGADFVGHLGKDIGNAAVGFGPGLYTLGHGLAHDATKFAEHPVGYNPKRDSELRHTVVEPMAKQYADYYGHNLAGHVYQHPLQPILDALTVVDLGGSLGAKLGVLSDARVGLETRSPRAIATGKGPVHVDLSSTKPFVRGREKIINDARQARPEGIKAGPVTVGGELKRFGKQIQQHANRNALENVTPHGDYAAAVKKLSPDEWAALHIRALDIHPYDLAELWKGTKAESTVTDPKIARLALEPSKRMALAEPQLRALSKAGERLYRQGGKLKEDTATARASLTKRQAGEVLGRPVKEITGDPYYFPHVPGDTRPVSPLQAAGGGKGIPRKVGSMKQSTGSLALSGKLHLRGDILGPEFLRRVKYVKYDEIHNGLLRGAVPMTAKEIEGRYGGLPKGWEYIRAKPSERVAPTIRGESATHVPIDKLIPNAEDLHDSELAKQGFSTTDPAQAHTIGGKHFIAPSSTIKAATGEFTRSNEFVRHFVNRPLSVWRSLVLGLRPGFLTNNLVGNSIMYAAKTGGQGALRDLIGAIKETHGADVAKSAIDHPATSPAVRADLYKEFFPEQVQGTFGRTQSPATSPIHAAGRGASEAFRNITGAVPRLTSKVAEEYPRRALIRHYIRHSPEFRQVYKQLPKQTRSFEQAARNVLDGNGGAAYQRYISKQVNQALGDYLNLSPVERNVLRNALPFYAWYKAISTTTFHLAADTPLRANILGQLGQIGKQRSDTQLGEIPTFLEGAIPVGKQGGNTERVLATQGLNPYASLTQLLQSGGDVSSLGLNPFLMAALDSYAKAKNSHTGSGNIGPGSLIAAALSGMARDLPFSRVIAPQPPSKLYPKRNRKSELESYFGVPIKQYDKSVAAQDARKGR